MKSKKFTTKMAIPKIIHQIWIGTEPMPEYLVKCCNDVRQAHPSWEYILWDNEKAKSIFSSMRPNVLGAYNRYIEKKQWAFASDILRYWILYWIGGIYLDCDFRMNPTGSLDMLPMDKELILLNMREKSFGWCRFQNCFMGSNKKHPYIKRIVKYIDNTPYQLTSLNGAPVDKHSCQYLTTEFRKHINWKCRTKYKPKCYHRISLEEIGRLGSPDDHVLDKQAFIGKNAYIATHLWTDLHGEKPSEQSSKRLEKMKKMHLTHI